MQGATPKAARTLGAKLKSYPRITFHISIKGDVEMEYRIEEKQDIHLVGVVKHIRSSRQMLWQMTGRKPPVKVGTLGKSC